MHHVVPNCWRLREASRESTFKHHQMLLLYDKEESRAASKHNLIIGRCNAMQCTHSMAKAKTEARQEKQPQGSSRSNTRSDDDDDEDEAACSVSCWILGGGLVRIDVALRCFVLLIIIIVALLSRSVATEYHCSEEKWLS